MITKVPYILLFITTLLTITSIYAGGTYTIKGILGIIFFTSCILKDKLKNRNKIVNLTFYISATLILVSFILKRFL